MRRRRTPGGYVRFLQLLTAGALAPAAVGVFRLFFPLGAVVAGVATAATATAVLAPVGARIRFGFQDTRRSRRSSALALAYDAAWMTSMLSPITTVLSAVVLLLLGRFAFFTACELGLATSAAIAGYGVLIRRRWVRRRRLEVTIPGLPPAFDGYRIAHLSDLHIGSIDRKEEALAWVHATNDLRPDLVAITGDVLTTGSDYHDDVVEVLAELRARDGVVGCLGNHDYYDEDALVAKLASRHVKILRNEGVGLERDGARLFVAGVEDMWRGHADLEAALARRDGAPVVLLAHNPDYFPKAMKAGVGLTLSGHTHAGQIAVPFLVSRATLSHLVTRWPAGLFREGDSQIFVHAGLGTTGPAIRLGAAPELVEIVLRAKPSPPECLPP